jgi:GNAT superfamily N-acetyltransferase
VLRTLVRRVVPRSLRAPVVMLWDVVSEWVYLRTDAVIVEKSTGITLPGRAQGHASAQAEIVNVLPLVGNDTYFRGLATRFGSLGIHRARRYLRNGYGGVALVRGDRVVGDVWYVTLPDARLPYAHPDVRLMRISLDAATAYSFNMYVEPDHRSMAASAALFEAVFAALRQRGIEKVVGAYRSNYMPALWMHRLAGFREVRRVRIHRVFRCVVSYSSTAL